MKQFRHRVIVHFLAVFILVFVFATALSLYVATANRVSEAEDSLAARIGTQLARTAGSIDLPTLKNTPSQAASVLAPLMSDPAVTCAEILIGGVALKGAEQPRKLGCAKMSPESSVDVPIGADGQARLKVGFSRMEIRKIEQDAVSSGLFMAGLAVLVSAAIGTLAFRKAVGKPVRRLLATVRSVANDGTFRHAHIARPDEIGELCAAFNDMQDRLQAEQATARQALEHIDHMYHATPAMLFTLSGDGIVRSVSEHWLLETGYSRNEVTGKPLEHFICLDSRDRLKQSVISEMRQGAQLREVPLRVWCKSGAEIDVLLSTVPDRRQSESGTFVCVMNDVTLLRTAERDLRSLALTDPLTGLPNRLGLAEFLNGNKSMGGTVMFIDLDNFKTINDTYGHTAGDKALLESAARVREIVGDKGIVARIGGDEFAVALPGMAEREDLALLADAIVVRLSVPIILEHSTGHIGASIGIAICNGANASCDEALRHADQAMYVAKNEGKNRFAFFEEECGREIKSRALQVQLIQNGLEHNWFEIAFQPIIDMKSSKPIAFEALLRLNRDECPFGSTEEIIKVAEESGQMVQLGDWILRESCRQFEAICARPSLGNLALSVNLSPRQLTEGFVRNVRHLFRDKPDLRGRLIFEVTETAAIRRFDVVERLLCELKQAGARIAIDDFGTGYSSLSYISRLPVDILKLDKSFVSMAVCPDGNKVMRDKQVALMKTMATLARELHLEIVAEGLETADAADFVRKLGMKYGQGYAFAMPMPAAMAADWAEAVSASRQPRISKAA